MWKKNQTEEGKQKQGVEKFLRLKKGELLLIRGVGKRKKEWTIPRGGV